MKTLTLKQLTTWKPCSGWTEDFQRTFGSKATMVAVEKELLKRKDYSALNWLIGKRLEQLTKRHACAFAYLCSHRALKYARKQDIEVLKTAQSFARIFALTGKVDIEAASAARSAARSAAWSAAWSAEWSAVWSAESAESAAWSAAWSAESAESAARSAARSAAWSAAWSAESAESAESAARSAEYRWQLKQLARIEMKLPTRL